ncbi:MAG: DUF2089 domain-containing protein [Clostridiales bacterium]|nr:DUF2089 domain-containing protein [Clostridiales bacterium]
MKNREALGKCPICDGNLKITEITCGDCGTSIRGKFDPCKFCRLTKEQKYFIEVFIKNRGNIKEIEKELGISYPTVRNKLDEVIEAMGYHIEDKIRINRKEILDKLSKGEIDKDEALRLLSE